MHTEYLSAGVEATIRKRFSCRSYSGEAISAAHRAALERCFSAQADGLFNTRIRFTLISATDNDRRSLKGLVTYGFIRNPGGYIIGACSDGERNLEAYGYALEHCVLMATDLSLGTCWLGGSFSRSNFTKKLGPLSPGEEIPAVVAIGVMADPEKARNSFLRRQIKSENRLSWGNLFYDVTFGNPLSSSGAGAYAAPLEMVRLGPSASNKQPWRVVKKGGGWHFFLQRTPGYRDGLGVRLLKVSDIQRIDTGIAMCHFELMAKEKGLPGKWAIEEPAIDKPDALTEYAVSWIEG